MKYLRLGLFMGVLFLGGISQVLAAGSGGLRDETPDAGAFGKGSAFIGEANTPAAVYYNPAGMNQIKNIQISGGAALLAPGIDYKSNGGDVTQARRNKFVIPHMYAVAPVNERLAVGFGSGSYWGLGTEWAADSFSRYVATKTLLTNIDSMLAVSYKVTDQWSFAVSADNDYSKASEEKNLNNIISADGHAQLKAKDDAWGFRLATMFKINDQNQVGLMYRSPIHHKYEGKLYMDGLNPAIYGTGGLAGSNFGTSYETKVTDKVTLPQSIAAGYSFKPTNKWTFNVDVEWFNWSHLKQETLTYPDETNAGNLSILNKGNPIQHNWHSAFSESIGGEYSVSDELRLRAGYYHHTHVQPQGTFQSSNPDSDSHGYTLGFGYDISKNLTLDMSYSLIYYQLRKVNNNVGQSAASDPFDPNKGDISGKYKQFTNIGMATVTYKF